MGRLTRHACAIAVVGAWITVAPSPAAAFDGFGEMTADATYMREVRFDVELIGPAPDRLELLIRTPGNDSAFVVPVEVDGDEATYIWDTRADYVPPNTLVTYQWRAVEGEAVTLSDEGTVRYDDDRPGLDWQSEQLGETTIHWYGEAGVQARRFGELAAVGVEQAEVLLGTELAGPVDVFVYDTRDDFFGALGPGAREWTGAAAFSEIRTIFMWLEGGPPDYLETAILHEITHIVFSDATDNPFHEPATWVNEGIAVWLETGDAAEYTDFVREQAGEGGLFAFEAITARFPIGDVGSSLSYAQGGTMVDLVIDRYGTEAISRLTAAYRDGASDEEALEAATGIPAKELYGAFYAEFGVDVPTPVEPEPIPPSDVERPVAGEVDPGGVGGGPSPPQRDPAPGQQPRGGDVEAWVMLAALGAALVAALVVAILVSRRAAGAGSR